ncbi:MAG: hypothetical protein VB071_11475 [Lawsonibacter sp.]|nr:hypothetical protein [Lawsonibacter sp.]
MKKRHWKETLLMVWDILFVLILCFVVLLTTMLISKSSAHACSGYSIRLPLLGGVIVSLAVYLGFMLKTSLASLRRLVQHYFSQKEEDEP